MNSKGCVARLLILAATVVLCCQVAGRAEDPSPQGSDKANDTGAVKKPADKPVDPRPVTPAERPQAERGFSIDSEAPEIEGEDIDGVPFKLSDYRGNVVMLDFWGDW